MDNRTQGAELLESFLRDRGLPNAAAARAVEVSPVTLHHWLRGTIRPRGEKREAIEVWTGGVVPAESWSTAEERAFVEGIRPCEDDPTGPVATHGEVAA